MPEEKRKGHKAIEIPPLKHEAGTPAIEADGLTKRFGSFTAVDHVSFKIEKGEIFGFLGSNGCGMVAFLISGVLGYSRRL